jgi:hypothetical protein
MTLKNKTFGKLLELFHRIRMRKTEILKQYGPTTDTKWGVLDLVHVLSLSLTLPCQDLALLSTEGLSTFPCCIPSYLGNTQAARQPTLSPRLTNATAQALSF